MDYATFRTTLAAFNLSYNKCPITKFNPTLIKLNGIVAKIINVVRFVIAGLTAATMRTTSSKEIPMAVAYNGNVIHALIKQDIAIRIGRSQIKAVLAALRVFPSFL